MNTFKQFLIETTKPVTSFFDQQELAQYTHQRWKSRDKLVMMSPTLFLNLAYEGNDSIKEQRVLDMIKAGKSFELPFLVLNTHSTPGVIKVNGHEGRHRIRALQHLGYNNIPVLLKASSLRWSEQTNPNSFDYMPEWPTKIISESGKAYPFFITREQSPRDFS